MKKQRNVPDRAWDDDDPQIKETILTNLRELIDEDIVLSARGRDTFTVALPQTWHKKMLRGVPMELPGASGGYRGTGKLRDCIVHVEVSGHPPLPGVQPQDVPPALEELERWIAREISDLDDSVPRGAAISPEIQRRVIRLAADLHGEWVRIHPFADGNGRTGRMLANWVLIRYGFPALLSLRPRPTGRDVPPPDFSRYQSAARQSMQGRHDVMRVCLQEMLVAYRSSR